MIWPSGNYTRGIDASHYKYDIDWKAVANSGIKFGIVKATEASHYIDSYFDQNWIGMRDAGIIRGAYHFFRPNVDPKDQAYHYLKVVGDVLKDTDMPAVLDLEAYPQSNYDAFAALTQAERYKVLDTWLQIITDATGKLPIIYTNRYTWWAMYEDSTEYSHHPLWFALYNANYATAPGDDWNGKSWTMWQFTHKGEIPGIQDGKAATDCNVYNGDLESLWNWIGRTADPSTPPDISNASMYEAIRIAATSLDEDPIAWITKLEFEYLVDPPFNATRPYDGPAIEDLVLQAYQKEALIIAINNIDDESAVMIYTKTNQEIINAFYVMGADFDMDGWDLIKQAKLTFVVDNRYALYEGPTIEAMTGLDQKQKDLLYIALDLVNPNQFVVEMPEYDPEDIADDDTEKPEDDPAPDTPSDPEPEPVPVEEEPEPQPDPEPEPQPDPEPEPQPDPEPEPQPDPEPEPAPVEDGLPYSEMTNQQIVNFFYVVGEQIAEPGFELLESAGLAELFDKLNEKYDGLNIEALPNLSEQVRGLLLNLIKKINTGVGTITYPGLINQDIIDLIYKVAAKRGENGMHWVIRTGLGKITSSRDIRYQPYMGPRLENLPSITEDIRSFLAQELNDLQNG